MRAVWIISASVGIVWCVGSGTYEIVHSDFVNGVSMAVCGFWLTCWLALLIRQENNIEELSRDLDKLERYQTYMLERMRNGNGRAG